MLYRHSEIFRTLLIATDLMLVACAWLGAFAIRFHAGFDAPLGVPSEGTYLYALIAILPVWLVISRSHRLYAPRRTESLWPEAGLVIRSVGVMVVSLMALTFFLRDVSYSRGVVALFSVMAPALVIAQRIAVRSVLRTMRRRGYNLRYVVVVGGGRLASEIIERIHAHPEAGLRVYGVLATGPRGPRGDLDGVSVLADYSGVKQVLQHTRIDQVIVALPREDGDQLEKVLAELDDEHVSVKLAPDLLHVLTLRSSVESLDGLPIINLRESPMLGWAAVQKRCFDLVVSGLALLVAAPLMGVIAGAIWLSSGRPVFFVQDRIGLDGKVFRMFKFRTMHERPDATESPSWTRADDPRRTPLGRQLRRFSLDELPQFVNVLRGEMSLVGPRPERPALIESFRREIPGYVLRLKVKAGLTGWAQIHGWRGDTSLHERVEHDIHYIQNWSLALDAWIVLRTVWSALLGRNAY